MVIIRNIPNGIKILRVTGSFSIFRNKIKRARANGDFVTERKEILNAESIWGKEICKALGIEIEVEGRENLPDEGPVVYVSNHQSYSDIPIHFAVLDKFQFGFVAKENLGRLPFYGHFMKEIRSVFIDRSSARASMQAILEGVSYINDGFSLLIFPEGTRSRGPEMGPFHPGGLKLATRPEVPIVPVTLNGSYNVYENDGRISGAHIRDVVHEPIVTRGLSHKEKAELGEKVEEAVRSGLSR